MRAALINALAGPTAVQIRDVPEPTPASGQVLVDIHYTGVVFPDVLNTRGEYQMRLGLPLIPGWDVAGVVREDAEGFRAGDRVAAMPRWCGPCRSTTRSPAGSGHRVVPRSWPRHGRRSPRGDDRRSGRRRGWCRRTVRPLL